MNEKKCPECGIIYIPKSNNSKYCSKICKNKYWSKHKKPQCPEKNKIRCKKYRDTHKKEISESKKRCYRKKRRIYLDKMKIYYQENKEKIQSYKAEYHKKNSERLCKKSQKWYMNNKERASKRNLKYYHNNKDNIQFKMYNILRSRINSVMKCYKDTKIIKCGHTLELVGCDTKFLIKYLESKFTEGMSWDNYGKFGWHIDHIKPCCKFDLSKESEQRKCFHYTNLQPLWWIDNLKKQGKYDE